MAANLTLETVAAPAQRLWTAAELLNADFPEPVWIVPDILPEGTTILGGKPKLGKSWLAMQLAQAAGTGGCFLDYRIEQRRVLFLALEDSKRRLRSRMVAQAWPDLHEVYFLTECETTELERWLDETKPQLLVVDTFSRFFNLNQQDVQPVTEALGKLQTLVMDRGISALVLDHHNKAAGGEDAIGDLLGSTGKGAVADTIWGLYRERGAHDAKLAVLGRDVEEEDLRLRWDPRFCCWQIIHEEQAGKYDEVALQALANGPAGVSAIAKETGVNRGTLHDVLGKMARAGRVYQDPATKRYSLVA
ncbi:MAG: AAA family ATPase [Armatimonadota bacterium]